MKKWYIKRLTGIILTICLMTSMRPVIYAQNGHTKESHSEKSAETMIEAESGILMEAQTGTVLASRDANTRRSPASITKIMTLLLIFDAIKDGTISLNDQVTTSAYAKSMGGSQVFLEEGEVQDVETMVKCIVIASGNDASVAMAEYLAGSEQEFVDRMNKRAEGLGMKNTHFTDCCGLTDSDDHYTTARDIAIMSRELITKYPEILKYSSIWMETITHTTRQGTKEFGLTNTNKLLRNYDGCVGLKTGSTDKAKYCLSAVATRNNLTLIAVVMAAPDYKVRFRDAAALLNYGFANCSLYIDPEPLPLPEIPVKQGKKKKISLQYESEFRYLNTDKEQTEQIRRELVLPEQVQAPVKKGEPAGTLEYYLGDKLLGKVNILYNKNVEKAAYRDCLKEAALKLFFRS